MQETKSHEPDPWPVGWESHRNHEIVYTALHTTAAQRFAWLEAMLELLRPQMPQLLKARENDPDRKYTMS
ncbi:MAG: hypothetical protein ABSB74_13595 [Tepidisphaeraceae bacterium]